MTRRDDGTPFSFGAAPDEKPRPTAARTGSRRGWLLLGLVLLLAAGAAAVWHFRPEPAMRLLRGTPLEPPVTTTRAYKWRDADGGWQITDTPPSGDTPYETIEVRSDTNVLPLPPGLQGD